MPSGDKLQLGIGVDSKALDDLTNKLEDIAKQFEELGAVSQKALDKLSKAEKKTVESLKRPDLSLSKLAGLSGTDLTRNKERISKELGKAFNISSTSALLKVEELTSKTGKSFTFVANVLKSSLSPGLIASEKDFNRIANTMQRAARISDKLSQSIASNKVKNVGSQGFGLRQLLKFGGLDASSKTIDNTLNISKRFGKEPITVLRDLAKFSSETGFGIDELTGAFVRSSSGAKDYTEALAFMDKQLQQTISLSKTAKGSLVGGLAPVVPNLSITETASFAGIDLTPEKRRLSEELGKAFNISSSKALLETKQLTVSSGKSFSSLANILKSKVRPELRGTDKDFDRITKQMDKASRAGQKLAKSAKNVSSATGKLSGILGVGGATLASFNAPLGRVTQSIQQLSFAFALGNFSKIGKVVTGVTVAIGALLSVVSAATNKTFQMEERLIRLRRASGDVSISIENLRQRSFRLAQQLGSIDVLEVTKGIEGVVKAGVDIDKAFGAAGATTLEFARVAEISSEQAAKQLVSVSNQLGISFQRSADLIVGGADSSIAAIAGFGDALQGSAFAAKSLGINTNELVAILSAVSNQGKEGAAAATAFNRLSTELSDFKSKIGSLTADQTAIFTEFGLNQALEDFRRGKLTALDFLKTIAKAKDSTGNIIDIGPQSKLFQRFGKEFSSRLFILLRDDKKFNKELAKAAGFAGRSSAAFLDLQDSGLESFKRLGVSWDNFIQKLSASSATKNAIDFLTDLLNDFSGAASIATQKAANFFSSFSGIPNILEDLNRAAQGKKPKSELTGEQLIAEQRATTAKKLIADSEPLSNLFKALKTGELGFARSPDTRFIGKIAQDLLNGKQVDFSSQGGAGLQAVINSLLGDIASAKDPIKKFAELQNRFTILINNINDSVEGSVLPGAKKEIFTRTFDNLSQLLGKGFNAFEGLKKSIDSSTKSTEANTELLRSKRLGLANEARATQFNGFSIQQIKNSSFADILNLGNSKGAGSGGVHITFGDIKIDAGGVNNAEDLSTAFVDSVSEKILAKLRHAKIANTPRQEGLESGSEIISAF